jgi:hypothetical protein
LIFLFGCKSQLSTNGFIPTMTHFVGQLETQFSPLPSKIPAIFGPVRRSFLGPNLQDPSDALQRHAFHRVPTLAIIVDSKAAIGLATVGVGAIASKDRGVLDGNAMGPCGILLPPVAPSSKGNHQRFHHNEGQCQCGKLGWKKQSKYLKKTPMIPGYIILLLYICGLPQAEIWG